MPPTDINTPEGPVGSPQDHADYLDAIVAAFGEGMGDGAETTLACEIERLKRLAEQAVAVRQILGPESWHVDGEGIANLLNGRLAKIAELEAQLYWQRTYSDQLTEQLAAPRAALDLAHPFVKACGWASTDESFHKQRKEALKAIDAARAQANESGAAAESAKALADPQQGVASHKCPTCKGAGNIRSCGDDDEWALLPCPTCRPVASHEK